MFKKYTDTRRAVKQDNTQKALSRNKSGLSLEPLNVNGGREAEGQEFKSKEIDRRRQPDRRMSLDRREMVRFQADRRNSARRVNDKLWRYA